MSDEQPPADDGAPRASTRPARAGGVRATGKNARFLRALGHELDPVMQVGKNGLTEALVAETRRALARHELIKVKVQGEAPLAPREAAEELAAATDAWLAQTLGRTFLLFLRHPTKPKIELPDERKRKKVVPEGRNPGPSKDGSRKRKKPRARDDDAEGVPFGAAGGRRPARRGGSGPGAGYGGAGPGASRGAGMSRGPGASRGSGPSRGSGSSRGPSSSRGRGRGSR